MAQWPSSLPYPQQAGYGIKVKDTNIRTTMESGVSLARRTTFSRDDEFSVSWRMSESQMAAFRAWFDHRDGANNGAAWFDVSIATGDGGFREVSAMFSGEVDINMVAGIRRWDAKATLATRQTATSTDKWNYYELIEIPTLDLDFANQEYSYFDGVLTQTTTNPFSDLITFSRASIGWYYDINGDAQVAAIDEPRIDYDLTTHECLGLKIQSAESPETDAPDLVAILSKVNWLRADEGTFILDVVERTTFDGTARNFLTAVYSSGGENVAVFRRGPENSVGMSVTSGTVLQTWLETGNLTVGQSMTIASAYKVNDFYGTVDGGTGASASSGSAPSALDRLYIGAGASYLDGCINVRIKRIRYFPFRMSNARMQELTGA